MAKPKLLFYDIETQPIRGLVWGLYDQNVAHVEEDWKMLSVAWRFQGDSKISCVTRKQAGSEKKLVKEFSSVLNEADINIGHNENKFDYRKIKAKLFEYGLTPPKPAQSVDTLKQLRKHFALSSYKLGDVCKLLGIGEKIDTGGMPLWVRCMAGEKEALRLLVKYNKHDVVLLEGLYNWMLPWIGDSHPSLALLQNRKGCPTCLVPTCCEKRGFRVTKATRQQRWQCQKCAGWFVTRVEKAA